MRAMWGCSSVVERMLCMYEAPGSIPGISMFLLTLMRLYYASLKSYTVELFYLNTSFKISFIVHRLEINLEFLCRYKAQILKNY